MSKSRNVPNVAFVEEAEDDSNSSIEGVASTRVYAARQPRHSPEAPPTPTKELPNTGKSRRGEASASSSDSLSQSTKRDKEEARRAKERRRYKEQELDDRALRRADEKREVERMRELDRMRAKAEAKATKDTSKALKKTRPQSVRHSTTQPIVQQPSSYRRGQFDEPSHYGIPQPAASSNRPRANARPASYYAGQTRPPPPNQGWQHSPMPSSPFPPGGSYPPPPPMYGGPPPLGMHGGPPPPSPTGPPSGYFDPAPPPPQMPIRDLKQRFDRPSSAMGYQNPSPRNYHLDGYPDYDEDLPYIPKKSSRNKKQEEDRMRMPPPQFKPMREWPPKPMRDMPRRPSTTANPSTPFQPPPMRPDSRHGHSRPPHPSNRRSVGFVDQSAFDDDDLLGDNDLFHDISPQPPFPQRRRSVARSSRRDSLVYDDDDHENTPAVGRSSRRGSVYGSAALGSGGVSLEDDNRYMDAVRYQEDVSGGPQVPLTAETLRKANKRGDRVASSRSTRSSASRDESEYNKRSNTTGITRSSSGGDDFTIKVSGPAVVRVNGAEIACEDSEITFSNGGGGGSRGGSDHTSTFYQLEDGGHRERKALPHRTRAPSQSDSQSRGYVPSHAPWDQPYGNQHYI